MKEGRNALALITAVFLLFVVTYYFSNDINSSTAAEVTEETTPVVETTQEPETTEIVQPTQIPTEVPTATPVPTPRVKKVVKYKKGKLLSEHTIYHYSSYNRDINLKLYCEEINKNTWKKKFGKPEKGYFLKKGENFEWYNAIGGPPTEEEGYKLAGYIVNRQPSNSIGGGACEVSSTINSCVLKIEGIKTHASSHSVNPGYFRSCDHEASVAYGVKTFSFVNTLNYPILIRMSANRGVVNCKVYKVKKKVSYKEY